MKEWTCNVCGYTHKGKEAPVQCPKCGASGFYFRKTKDGNGCWSTIIIFTIIIMLGVIIFNIFACRSVVTVDNSTVKTLDISRYLGKWYEVARYDHRFERGMEQCTATYTLREDGKIAVTNKGIKNGKWKTSDGKAKLTDEPGVLRVSFFGPFYSDYRVMMLDPEYSYALVGGSSSKYLWILSRTPQLDTDVRDKIIREAKRRGYNTEQLIWVEHGQVLSLM